MAIKLILLKYNICFIPKIRHTTEEGEISYISFNKLEENNAQNMTNKSRTETAPDFFVYDCNQRR
jgi:hypothetical protein